MCARLCLKCWKGQCRKWFKSINSSCNGNQIRIYCVRGKYMNHIHFTGLFLCQINVLIHKHYVYIQFLYNTIQNTSLLLLYLISAFKAPEVDRKHVLLLPDIFGIKKQAYTTWWGESPTHGTYIDPKDLLTPDTERSLSHYGRVTFHW